MFIGSPPFFGENRLAILEKIKTEPITIPDTLKDLIADDLQSLILKMLHKDRNQRFESIDQLIKLVDKFEIISIPEEFKWTRSRTLKIDNEEEIKSLLNRAGFLSREISTIVSIANSLHSEPSIPVEDRTEILKPQQAVTITPAELNQAIERFRSLKTQRAFQATSGSFKSIPSDGKGKPAKPINVAWQNWGLSFIAVLGIIVASQVYRNIGVQKTDLASKSQLKFNPYGKVFIGDGVRVEVVTLEELNEIGLPYVLIRFSGSPAYSEGLDKKIGKYSPSPAGLAGFDYTIFEQGKGHTRFLTRKYPSNPNYAEAFLNGKENKVAEDPKESSALSTSEIVNEFVLQ
jgi:serine/threonine protein kinase